MSETTIQRAGKSVRRRGFMQGDDVMQRQVIRLTEELGEFCRSLRTGEDRLEELADVVIVCSAIAEYNDWPLDEMIIAKCARDETRGYQHGGKEMSGALVDVPTYAAQNGDDGHVYRDFG